MDELTLSIGDLARRTGVDISTLRRWERYEGLLAPARTPGGQRRYGRRDVEAILEVVGLIERGWPAASAAKSVADHRDTGRVVFDAALFDAVPAGVVITNADFEVLYANPYLARMLGFDPEEALSALSLDLLDEESLAEVQEAFREVRDGQHAIHAVRVRTRTGGEVELEVVAGPLLGAAGRIRGAIAVLRDLGRRRATQRELQVARGLLDLATDALVATDREGVVLAWNPAAETAFDVSTEDAVGSPLTDLLPGELSDAIEAAVAAALDGESTTIDVPGTAPPLRASPLVLHGTNAGATFVAATHDASASDPSGHPAGDGFQAVVATISQALLAGDETSSILATAVEGVARALAADHVAFVELHRSSGEQVVLASTVDEPAPTAPPTGPFGSHLAFAVQSQRPIVVRDFATERRFDRGPLAGERRGVSGVCVPVRWGDAGEGALCVHSSSRALPLSSADITFIQSAANLCALALAHAA